MPWWAGIDWSERGHDLAVVNAAGEVVLQERILESPEGVQRLLRLLAGLSRSNRHSRRHVPIAIETSHGLLVAALRAVRQPVVVINPGVVARYRGRITPTRRKADRTDAKLLADILRVDGHLHRRLSEPSAQAEAITVLARAQRRATQDQRYHAARLRSLLRLYYPAALEAWEPLPHKLLRAEARKVLALAPTPERAAQMTWRQLRDALIAGGRARLIDDHADRLHEIFRHQRLRLPPAVEEARGAETLAVLAQLDNATKVTETLTEQLTQAFLAHPQAPIYLSFPGVAELTGARLLAEIGDDPTRFTTARGLRAYAGAAPLTWASGTSKRVTARRIANRSLKGIGHMWAFASLNCSPGARAHYDRRRQAGDRHAAALRNLYGRLLSCLHNCLTHGDLYQEQLAFPPAAKSP